MSEPFTQPPPPVQSVSKTRQDWRTLAEQASREQDPHKLLDLVSQLCVVLEQSEERLQNPYREYRGSAEIGKLLQSSIAATVSDFGNVQLLDTNDDTLRIVAAQGFDSKFLDFFQTVRVVEGCACAAAMKDYSRVVIADVGRDPVFSAGARATLERSNVGSVQSTPIVDSSGRLLGIVSTHYRDLNGPDAGMWEKMDDVVATFLQRIA